MTKASTDTPALEKPLLDGIWLDHGPPLGPPVEEESPHEPSVELAVEAQIPEGVEAPPAMTTEERYEAFRRQSKLKRRRGVPKGVWIAVGSAALTLGALRILVVPGARPSFSKAAAENDESDLFGATEAELRSRQLPSAEDFRPAKQELIKIPNRNPRTAQPQMTQKAARKKATSYGQNGSLFLAPTKEQSGGAENDVGGRTLARAGDVLEVMLDTPLDLGFGGQTAIAVVRKRHREIPSGARFLGTASIVRGQRVDLQFSKLLLPGGTEIAVSAEARDLDGAFGVSTGEPENEPNEDEAEVASGKQAAKETAADVAFDALGFGMGGRAARSYLRHSTYGRMGSKFEQKSVRLPAGIDFKVFLHAKVELKEE